jgi:hypothetical protein
MIKKLLFLSVAMIFVNTMSAQPKVFKQPTISHTLPAHRNCATVEHNENMYNQHPELRAQRMQTLQAINKKVREMELNGSDKSNVVKTIPVVVHVVYGNASENISDAQVLSQIAILNKDYRKSNTDFNNNVNAAFGNVGADCQIEFCMAQQDPNGLATNGITRTATNSSPFSQAGDPVKYTAQGGHDAWPASKYLNIWVCDLSNSLLGYAQFPGGLAATDGVVIKYDAFGNTGAAATPYNLGRTTTHEVGHWLDLRHIWGDDGGACVSNGGSDDLISDTPEQKDQNYSCPNYPLTTGAGANCAGTNPGAMFMNYMDYTDDNCMYMFTNGQSTRMNAALTTSRSSLLTSNGCQAPSSSGGGCDSLSNWSSSYTENLYANFSTVNNTWGYVTGQNNYTDKAKAEYFNNVPANFNITGCYIKFGLATAASASSIFNFRIWNSNGAGGTPNTVLATKAITYASAQTDALAGAMTLVQFPSPVPVSSPFYAGIEFAYAAGDTIAVMSTSISDLGLNLGTSWEKWSDNTWNKIATNTTNGWGIDLGLRIIPVMCDSTTIVRENSANLENFIQVFPNPATNELFVNVSNLKNTSIVMSDITGKTVKILNAGNSAGVAKINTADLQRGIYMITISNPAYQIVRRVILE